MNDLDFYLKRLNPILDLETGTMVDEIDRMQLEIDTLKIDKEKLQKQFWHHVSEKPASRGCYLCRMKEDESIVYQDLKYDDGWYGQGYRSITHWAEIPMLLWKE